VRPRPGLALILRAAEAEREAWMRFCVPSEVARKRSREGGAKSGVGPGLTRWFLSECLGCAPAEVPIVRPSSQDKPFLDDERLPPRWRGLEFSRATTADHAWLVLAFDGPVGVDVEPWPSAKLDEVGGLDAALESLPPELAAGVLAQAPMRRQRAFFEAWTRYEAWVKCTGEGVSVFPGELPPYARLATFDPGPGHVGAIASTRAFEAIRRVDVAAPRR
jgi:phosphopantetheinyl transferase